MLTTIRTVLADYIALFGARRLVAECIICPLAGMTFATALWLFLSSFVPPTASTVNPSPAVEDAAALGER